MNVDQRIFVRRNQIREPQKSNSPAEGRLLVVGVVRLC